MDTDSIDLHQKNILIVDDETDLREIVAGELEFMGAKVFQAENIQHALDLLSLNPIDLMISDIRMPGGSGIELLDLVKKKNGPDFPVILITGFADISAMDAYGKGAEALLNKPFQLDELFKIVAKHIFRKHEWLHSSTEAKKTVQPLDHRFVIGRGGLSLLAEMKERVDPGETVRFDFEIDGNHISGTGVCRWIKSVAPGTAVLGLEFSSFDEETCKKLPGFKRSSAYIPTSSEL